MDAIPVNYACTFSVTARSFIALIGLKSSGIIVQMSPTLVDVAIFSLQRFIVGVISIVATVVPPLLTLIVKFTCIGIILAVHLLVFLLVLPQALLAHCLVC